MRLLPELGDARAQRGGGGITYTRSNILAHGSFEKAFATNHNGKSFTSYFLPHPKVVLIVTKRNSPTCCPISRDQFKTNLQMSVAKYMNWWPARPLMAAAIARRVSFQMELAWNFLEAHHESVVKVNGDIFLGGLLAAVSLACLVWNDASVRPCLNVQIESVHKICR